MGGAVGFSDLDQQTGKGVNLETAGKLTINADKIVDQEAERRCRQRT